MIQHNNQQAIFTSMRQALTQSLTPHQFGGETTARAHKNFYAMVPGFGFNGVQEGHKAPVLIYAGSQVDNRDSTRDSVHFSYEGREYESTEYAYENSLQYGLMLKQGDEWRNCSQVFAANDELV